MFGDFFKIPWGFSGDSVGISFANPLIPMDRAKDYEESLKPGWVAHLCERWHAPPSCGIFLPFPLTGN
jgi:hypothetical protein